MILFYFKIFLIMAFLSGLGFLLYKLTERLGYLHFSFGSFVIFYESFIVSFMILFILGFIGIYNLFYFILF